VGGVRATLIWTIVTIAIVVPLIAAAVSPLIEWREPVYIAAGFAGVMAMALLLIQPLLAGGYLPGISVQQARRTHRIGGFLLVVAVLAHVAGLWITSPPDVIDALLFASPTPFSYWGVIAMWGIFATALLAVFRRKFRFQMHSWRRWHGTFAVIVVLGSAVHAVLIEGTMEVISKAVLCALAIIATITVLVDRGVFEKQPKPPRGRN
jgi:predicted ferric reductase